MAKDIFPVINIPVVGVIWMYNGLPAQEMERRITTVSERALTTSVNNIEHIESNSFNGIAVIKVYLHQGASVDAAISEVTAECQTTSGSVKTVQKLFDLAQSDPVRVFVNVPQ